MVVPLLIMWEGDAIISRHPFAIIHARGHLEKEFCVPHLAEVEWLCPNKSLTLVRTGLFLSNEV